MQQPYQRGASRSSQVRRHAMKRSSLTIHNEHNGVPVSSDDSSDDDDVISRTSRASKMTVHNEANGIWVSSDDEQDDEDERRIAHGLPPSPPRPKPRSLVAGQKRPTFGFRGSPRPARPFPIKPVPLDSQDGFYQNSQSGRPRGLGSKHKEYRDRFSKERRNSGYSSNESSHSQRQPVSNNYHGSRDCSSEADVYDQGHRYRGTVNVSSWSPASKSTVSTMSGRTNNSASTYWSSSESEAGHRPYASAHQRSSYLSTTASPVQHPRSVTAPAGGLQLRGPAGYGMTSYDSFESISLTSDHGYTSCSSAGTLSSIRRRRTPLGQPKRLGGDATATKAPTNLRNSTPIVWEKGKQANQGFNTPTYSYNNSQGSDQNTQDASFRGAPAGVLEARVQGEGQDNHDNIQLHSIQFWDPDGSRAWYAERGLQVCGISATLSSLLFGHYVLFLGLLVVTIMSTSYFSTMYRLLNWRKRSGIEYPALFNDLYEYAEQVATDTRVVMPSGELQHRLICSGEIGNAIERHGQMLDTAVRLRFWVEACVHFRLTLRNGCHHLGGGRLPPRSLTTGALALKAQTLPTTICPSCDNKIEIERRFPLKCD